MHPRPSLPFGRHGEDARPFDTIKKKKTIVLQKGKFSLYRENGQKKLQRHSL